MNLKFASIAALLAISATTAFADLPKATELVSKMGFGYNIGNTLEVPANQGGPTGWGNPMPSPDYIDSIQKAGFKTVRLPTAWYSHSSLGQISKVWLDSVQTVVDMCLKKDLYVVLNSHWDTGWLEDHVFAENQERVLKYQTNFWSHIADRFKNYDEHVIFASANEPGVNDPRGGSGAEYADNGQLTFGDSRMKILKAYHEAAIKAIRKAGGNNPTRTIVVQMPRTEIDKYELLAQNFPEDPAGKGYIMAEAHYYPYQYSLMEKDEGWGNQFYYYDGMGSSTDASHNMGSAASVVGSKLYTDAQFDKLKNAFTDKGIPVIIGEMGAIKRMDLTGENLRLHLQGRAAFYGYTAQSAKTRGIIPIVWDTGAENNKNMTIIRRQQNVVPTIFDYEVLNALREAYSMPPLEGNSIDSYVNKSLDDSEKSFKATYQFQGDTAETGTLSYKFSAQDWSQYKAISFDMSFNGSADASWSAVVFFNMSGNWDWKQTDLGSIPDFNGSKKTYTVSFDGSSSPSIAFTDQSKVVAFGINVQGTHVTGNIELDNFTLIKKDGTKDTILDFNKGEEMETGGIASVANGSTGIGEKINFVFKANSYIDNFTYENTITEPLKIVSRHLATNKLMVRALPGAVQAVFTTANSGRTSAKLMNSLGQVIAAQDFTAKSGANAIQLATSFRGPAFLIVKQGSRQYTAKVMLR